MTAAWPRSSSGSARITPGKHLLGMRVIKGARRRCRFLTMLGRDWIGKWIAGMVLALGYVRILIDREHQGWRDKLLATYVVEAWIRMHRRSNAVGILSADSFQPR